MGEEEASGVISPEPPRRVLGPLQAPYDPLRERRPLVGMACLFAQPVDLCAHVAAGLAIGARLGEPAQSIRPTAQRPCLRVRR
jgi:hypothetical protein